MAISSTTNRNDYVGASSTGVYAYSFRILLESHLRVTVRDLTGNETTLALTTDYTVSGVRSASGGNVTLVNSGQSWLTAGNLTTGYALAIRRVLPLTQISDFRNQGDFFPETHEDEFDRGVMVAQQQQDELARSLRLPETEAGSAAATTLPLAADRAGQFLAFDGSGNPVASAGVSDVPVSAFMETVVDDASGSAALTTLRNDLVAETAPAANDEVFLRDTSALTVDRMTLADLLKVINALAVEAAPAVDDQLALYDTSAGATDKITLADLLKVVNGLTEDANPDIIADFLLAYDTSAGTAKKVRPESVARLGNALRQELVVKTNVTNPNFQVDVDAVLLSVQGLPLSAVNLTADITASGTNGLDTGAEASSTWYAVHVITNDTGTLVASLLSLSPTAPTLPGSYTKFRRVGWVRNNASSNFFRHLRIGDKVYYDDATPISFSSPSGTTSFATAIPPTITEGEFAFFAQGAVVESNSVTAKPTGSPITPIQMLAGVPSGGNSEQAAWVGILRTNSSQQMDIASNFSVTLTVRVTGFIDIV